MRCPSPRFVAALLVSSGIHCSVDDRLPGLENGRAEPDAGQGGSAGSVSAVPGENTGGSSDASGPLTCSDSCSLGQTACLPGGLATCSMGSNGCAEYGTPVACGEHQGCVGGAGMAECACVADPVCASAGAACASPSTLATCSADADGCFYASSTSPCENGACSGNACCTNTCTLAPAQCGSSSSLEACILGANGCSSVSSTACGTGLVCERAGDAACADPNWAQWPMPNAISDVNAGAPNPENYIDNEDGTATDNRTKLIWQTGTSPSTLIWDSAGGVGSAQAYCSGITLAGFSDWRLPTLIELFSLLDIGATDPGNGRIFSLFPTPTDTFFWSATPSAGDAGFAWSMYYSGVLDAFNNVNQASAQGLARCVR